MIAHDALTTVSPIDPGHLQASRPPEYSPLPRLELLLGRRPDPDDDDDPPPKAPRVFPGL